MGESHSIRSLLCTENESSLNEEMDDEAFIDMTNYSVSEEEDEYVKMLLDRERNSGFTKDESLVFDKWTQCARLEAINWILKVSIFNQKLKPRFIPVNFSFD